MIASLAIELLASGEGDLFGRYSLLAIVQGLTEFLPVSSSGHLVLTQAALDVEAAPLAVDIALHVGTLVAVLIVYRTAVLSLVKDLARGEFKETLLLGLATVPVAFVGLLFKDEIEHAFGSPRMASFALLGTAVILTLGDWGRRRNSDKVSAEDDRLTAGAALLIGTAQCLALLPGVSRSGTTIAAGLLLGLSPAYAARVSFLLSIPAIAGAAILSWPKLDGELSANPVALAGAMLVAAVVGWIALRFLLRFLNRGAFVWFALYCAMLGGGYLILV